MGHRGMPGSPSANQGVHGVSCGKRQRCSASLIWRLQVMPGATGKYKQDDKLYSICPTTSCSQLALGEGAGEPGLQGEAGRLFGVPGRGRSCMRDTLGGGSRSISMRQSVRALTLLQSSLLAEHLGCLTHQVRRFACCNTRMPKGFGEPGRQLVPQQLSSAACVDGTLYSLGPGRTTCKVV